MRRRARSLEDIIGAAIPAVVSIDSNGSRGTGFFAAPGTVLTNAHVVEGQSSVTLTTANGEVRARVTSVAAEYDLAVLRVVRAMPESATLPLGSTASVRVGQEVIAIGFALGLLQNTVTRGIVSAIRNAGPVTFVQTDAAINPGNSGGPLIDAAGNVIGITTLKFGDQAESLGFAVAIDHAKALLSGRTAAAAAPRPSAGATPLLPLLTPDRPSTAEQMRRQGVKVFEDALIAIARRADELDGYWDRFERVCLSESPRGNHDRDWFSLYDGRVSVDGGSAQCASWFNELTQDAGEVRTAIATATDTARRAGVYPGVQRDRLRRHRLDWRGWSR